MKVNNCSILDCTLRDGGHALEDIKHRQPGHKIMNRDSKIELFSAINKSKVDFIEIGSISDGRCSDSEISLYKGIDDAVEDYGKQLVDDQTYSIIYRDPHIYDSDIPAWNKMRPKVARVIIRYFDLEKSFAFCRKLARLGYTVFIQPMATVQYSNDELSDLCDLANEISAGALYVVDTYGSMYPRDISKIYTIYNRLLNPTVAIGLHAHDNLGLAFSNALGFISFDSVRRKIVDSTVYGMGLGAGNCKTELICAFLNKERQGSYLIESIVEGCEIIESLNVGRQSWGVGFDNTLSALEGVATKYVSYMRSELGLSYTEIYTIIRRIPVNLRQQYTRENMNYVIESFIRTI